MFVCCPPLLTTRQRSSRPRRPCEDSFVVSDDETISKHKWTLRPQAGRRERFWTICPVPSSIDLSIPLPRPPSNGHFTPRPEQSDYPANEEWQWQEEISTWANHHHVLSPMGFKRQNSPVPSLPCKQTPRQPTPGLSGTQWSEELFREPSQTKEPPIPGPSQSSQPPEDNTTREPEPEVAPTQSTEEPFACPATPRSIIIIDDTPVGSAPPPPLLLPRLSHLPILFPPPQRSRPVPQEPQRLLSPSAKPLSFPR
ncbi:hypothetical protein O181_063032 [Austropuccinia psidii MF-1]|uniref:Uncharacterized protein n=1 Tax=Austropuccinia psidii MF-1 TaxID=1389203 RepID=A0A9Q3I0X5_9BASI|nr:hypothetical protein [Austropuccinia psidii MF-1]